MRPSLPHGGRPSTTFTAASPPTGRLSPSLPALLRLTRVVAHLVGLFAPMTPKKPGTGIFTPDPWCGGFYELALEYTSGAPGEVVDGLQRLWMFTELDGCYLDRDREPEDQDRVSFPAALQIEGHLQGVARFTDGARVACGTYVLRDMEGSDWLVFYLPIGSLGRVFPVGAFPFDREDHNGWQVPLETWLAHLGQKLFQFAPYKLGVVGFEISMNNSAAALALTGVPLERDEGLLVPNGGRLAWFPRTTFQ